MEVHCAPEMLHVPRAGHSAGSTPLTWHTVPWALQVPVTLVQAALVTHCRPDGLLHVPGVGEHPLAAVQFCPAGVTQLPFVWLQVAAAVHCWPAGLAQVPGVGPQAAADVHWVAGG